MEPSQVAEAAGSAGDKVRSERGYLIDRIKLVLEASSSADRLLVVIDQFEELFTLADPKEVSPWIRTILSMANEAPASVLITLRADFYGKAIAIDRDLSQVLLDGQINLGPMTREELRRAIEVPAKRAGVVFSATLVNRILDDVESEPGSLPLLEFALRRLWEHRREGRIDDAAYDAIGRVSGAIARV